MRLPFCCLAALLICSSLYAQISTTKVAKPPGHAAPVARYDSLDNFLGGDVALYLGQELYLPGKHEILRKFGYRNFFYDYRVSLFSGGVYKPDASKFSTVYDSLVGRYFSVIDVIHHPRAEELPSLYGSMYYLKLIEKSSRDTLYFEYKAKYQHEFPFIVVGYFEKLRRRVIGQKYVLGKIDEHYNVDSRNLDINTAKKIDFRPGEKWECFDVSVEERNFDLSLMLRDSRGQVFALSHEAVFGEYKSRDVYTAARADALKAKFGTDNWNTVLSGKVRVGMSKEMCRTAWGEPNKVNRTITSGSKTEQWVYDGGYLYFTNDKLTAIQ